MHHRPVPKFKNSKILHTDSKVERATPPSAAAGRKSWCVPSHHAVLSGWMRPQCVSHHGGEAIAPCLVPIHLHSLEVRHRDSCTASLGPRASKKDTSVHMENNPAPLRRIIGFRTPNTTRTPHNSPIY
ncbi:hypothetical protein TcCL_NonESM09213 [Trypanosoma cruzi]|nr:hypothetical protein TcCL_NonESM09213 [Trypanosoma cruzi]